MDRIHNSKVSECSDMSSRCPFVCLFAYSFVCLSGPPHFANATPFDAIFVGVMGLLHFHTSSICMNVVNA